MLNRIAKALKDGRCFLLLTHKDPDGDGIGSMLALGKTLLNAKKDVVLSSEAPVTAPVSFLKGSEMIVQNIDFEKNFDAIIVLDCGEKNRVGGANGFLDGTCPLINIDHHETNDFFGDLNLVDQKSSSTGELVYNIIKTAGLSVDLDVAENIFAAIQTDTGSFRYENTTPACLKIAAEMIEFGVKPWQISQKMMDGYNPSRLRLLGMALDTIEFHYDGKICIMMISLDMLKKANANWEDSERFVDYPRSVLGVEIAVLIRQKGKNICKFSLRSVNKVNVAQLASGFGGGGHAKAAGFECKGDIGVVKRNFLGEAGQVLNGISD